ncbi:MAG: ATP-binding protein [Clostridia bacterium]
MSFEKTHKGGSLSHRLAIVYAILFISILLILSVSVFFVAYRFLVRRQTQNMKSVITLVADQIVEELHEGDSLTDPLLLAEQNTNMNLNMYLRDPRGSMINHARNYLLTETLLPDVALRPTLIFPSRGCMILCMEESVMDGATLLGSLYFALNLQDEVSFLKLLGILLLLANIIGAVIATILGMIASNQMLAPISCMINAANRINFKSLDSRLAVPETNNELRDLALTINAMLTRVEDAFLQQGRFAADASHELRTPLAVLQGNVDMLERWGVNDPAVRNESIAQIQRQTRYMSHLVENLLFLARGDLLEHDAKREFFSVEPLLRELVDEQIMLDGSHAFLLEADSACRLLGNRSMVRQLLQVLVDNSKKYTPAGGAITLRCAQDCGTVSLSVSDTGIGIEPIHLPHIFERFYRADKARSRTTGGMGLGLSIASVIVCMHSGQIVALSQPGQGTTITAMFPRPK